MIALLLRSMIILHGLYVHNHPYTRCLDYVFRLIIAMAWRLQSIPITTISVECARFPFPALSSGYACTVVFVALVACVCVLRQQAIQTKKYSPKIDRKLWVKSQVDVPNGRGGWRVCWTMNRRGGRNRLVGFVSSSGDQIAENIPRLNRPWITIYIIVDHLSWFPLNGFVRANMYTHSSIGLLE